MMGRCIAAWVVAFAAAASAQAATPGVATGGWHSLALHRDGTVRSWGDDSHGALGIGRPLVSATPQPVAGLSGVIAVSAGVDHAVALRNDGTVWTWGNNEYGQLGDGGTTSRSLPGRVVGLSNVVQVAAGRSHTVARTADGAVWTWGYNDVGQLGDDGDARTVPARVAGIPAAAEVAAGPSHTVVRATDGTVWAWGENDYGQLGDGTRSEPYRGRSTPTRVAVLTDAVQVSAGARHTLARTADGSVWAWGDNSGGALGDGTTIDHAVPQRVLGLPPTTLVSAGILYSLARGQDGSVWSWGGGGYGQMGDGLYLDRATPIRLDGAAGATALAAGFLHSFVVMPDGRLVGWGANANGQLGNGTTASQPTPAALASPTGITAVAVGAYFTMALRQDGIVLTWGDNSRGQLGNGAFTFRSVPSVIDGLSGVRAVSGGYLFSLALMDDGRVMGWGDNLANMFLDDSVGQSRPVPIPGLANVVAISAGYYHAMALHENGTVRAFGSNYRGRLGLGNEDSISEAVPVPGLVNVRQVSAGGGHTLALLNDGTVRAWGENGSGQLGDGTTTDRLAPVIVQGLTDVVEVSAGGDHSLARKSDGSVWAWGENGTGQLGDGGDTRRLLPVRVPSLPPVRSITAARGFSMALVDGAVWAWGVNYSGGIGCPGCEGRLAPVQLPGVNHVVSLSARQSHVLALRDDGSVLSWGAGQLGELGDGTLVDREAPVAVLREGGAGSLAGNDWFLDLDPTVASSIPAGQVPRFLVAAAAQGADITATLRYRAEDVGTTGSVYVFALAPASIAKGAGGALAVGKARKRAGAKDTPPACVLAQLSATGQMVAVTSASLSSYLTGVLQSQGQAVSLLNGASPANAAGATFFVGYGSSAGAMLNGGNNRAVATIPGPVTCQPQAPQTGWWWNPLEDGRGFSVEVRGSNLFFASFLYDVSGRSTWYVSSGPASLDGSFYSGELLAARGGQTLGGTYPGFPTLSSLGNVTLAFNSASTGTMVWPGGTVPIQRFDIVPNGLATGPAATVPESGWWWNEQEAGRGFFMEWQGATLDIAGYMYDDAGDPVWYLTVGEQSGDGRSFTGSWWRYGNGQALTGPWKPNTRLSTNVAPLSITFSGPDTALMTLPNGRTTALTRHRF